MTRHVVARAEELPPGSRKLIEAGGRPIALFNVDGEYFAILDRCPHEGGSLSQGYMVGRLTSACPGEYAYAPRRDIVRCPWHAWEFDLRTGQSWCDPARMRVRSFPVEREHGDAVLAEHLATETFPVERDGDYIVVEV